MTFTTFKGYVLVILSGLLILAGALIIALQWNSVSQFSQFRPPVVIIDGKMQGGINTAVLMLLSAAGGVVFVLLCKVFLYGVKLLRKAQGIADMKAVRRHIAGSQPPQQASSNEYEPMV